MILFAYIKKYTYLTPFLPLSFFPFTNLSFAKKELLLSIMILMVFYDNPGRKYPWHWNRFDKGKHLCKSFAKIFSECQKKCMNLLFTPAHSVCWRKFMSRRTLPLHTTFFSCKIHILHYLNSRIFLSLRQSSVDSI